MLIVVTVLLVQIFIVLIKLYCLISADLAETRVIFIGCKLNFLWKVSELIEIFHDFVR